MNLLSILKQHCNKKAASRMNNYFDENMKKIYLSQEDVQRVK